MLPDSAGAPATGTPTASGSHSVTVVPWANLLILHTAVGMTNALAAAAADGHGEAISGEALAGLSPYQTEHVNRFGDCVLDLSQPPAPLPFALPARRRTRRRTMPSADAV